MKNELPEHFHILNSNEKFCFACHTGVPCFTECCRQLDLTLTPYDTLRLKNRLKLHSGTFLEQYVIIEWDKALLLKFAELFLQSLVIIVSLSAVLKFLQG